MQTASVKHVLRADQRFFALRALLAAMGAVLASSAALPVSSALANTTGGAAAGTATTSASPAATTPSAGATATPSGGAAPGVPQTSRPALATWFGPGFYGSTTACGQRMSPKLVGVASRTLPCGTLVQIAYRGRNLTVPVVDRGPYGHIGASWDLTAGTARALKITETVRITTEIVGSLPNTPALGEPTEASSAQPSAPAEPGPSAVAASSGGAVAR
jgi:peptidoglycan lytic transglycosylase